MSEDAPWTPPTTANPDEPFVECPMQGGRKGFKVVAPRVGEKLLVQALGQKVRGMITHYFHDHTILCVARWGACEGCSQGIATRWEGYLAVRQPRSGARLIAKFTEAGYRNSAGLVSLDGKLRGHMVESMRDARRANSPVRYMVRTLPFDPDLPLAHDIGPTLCFMFGIGLDSQVGRSLLDGARADLARPEGNGHA